MTRPRIVTSLLAIGIAVAALWPAPWRAVFGQRDAVFSAVILEQLSRAITGAASFWDAPLAAPLSDGTTQADWALGPAILGLPLRWLGIGLMTEYAALVVLGVVSTAVAAGWLTEALVGMGPWVIFGILGGLSTIELVHAQHLNLVWHGITIASGAAMYVGFDRGRPAATALGGALVGVAFQFGIYLGVQTGFVAVVVVVAALAHRRAGASTVGAAVAGIGVSMLPMVPVLLRYANAARLYGSYLAPGELEGESVDLTRILAPIPGVPLHAPLAAIWPAAHHPAVDVANPGYALAALALYGAFRLFRERNRPWAWTAVAAIVVGSALLALGPWIVVNGHPTWIPAPMSGLLWIPGVSSLRAPARWLALTFCALGLLSAYGARVLVERSGLPWALMLLPVAMAELVRPEMVTDLAVPAGYRLLADSVVPGPFAEKPAEDGCNAQHRMLAAVETGHPTVGGHYARRSKALDGVNQMVLDWPAPSADRFLRAAGVRLVLQHPPFSAVPADVACTEAERHRLCVLPAWERRFEEGPGPVEAVRFAMGRPARDGTVTVHCTDGLRTIDATPWRLLAVVRGGDAAPSFDVPLDTPCILQATIPRGGVGLVAR